LTSNKEMSLSFSSVQMLMYQVLKTEVDQGPCKQFRVRQRSLDHSLPLVAKDTVVQNPGPPFRPEVLHFGDSKADVVPQSKEKLDCNIRNPSAPALRRDRGACRTENQMALSASRTLRKDKIVYICNNHVFCLSSSKLNLINATQSRV
jgi:hypothetical protein